MLKGANFALDWFMVSRVRSTKSNNKTLYMSQIRVHSVCHQTIGWKEEEEEEEEEEEPAWVFLLLLSVYSSLRINFSKSIYQNEFIFKGSIFDTMLHMPFENHSILKIFKTHLCCITFCIYYACVKRIGGIFFLCKRSALKNLEIIIIIFWDKFHSCS